MSKDKIFGLGLAGVSLLLAMGTGLFFLVTGGFVSVAQFSWPALGFLVGTAIIFFSFVEGGLNIDDEIENFPLLVHDDVEDLRRGIITPTHLFVLATVIAAGIELVTLFWFRKIEAYWGSLNVIFVALVVVALTLVLALRSGWFQIRRRRLATRVYVIPAVGWLICILVGIYFAEPIEYGGPTQLERSQAVPAVTNSVVGRQTTYFIVNNMGDAVTNLDCDDEGCLLVLLIAVVAISVIASATVPHFWVVATMMLLTLMAVITLRELLYRDKVY